jgi:RNA polymerase sigma-70 factor (ECF subfamily)
MDGEPGDEELMQRYRDGDAAAFETLYARHKGALYRYFLRQCGNEGLAEELFQDVWMKLIKARDRYEPRARFGTWLYTLAHNQLVDHYRRSGNRAALHESTGRTDPETLPGAASETPDQRTHSRLLVERLLELLKGLPGPQREAFLLREEGGLGVEAIAVATGVSKETAKSRLRYAVRRLRDGLG